MSAGACEACLARMALLGRLAPYIERIATGEPGSRAPELLKLGDEQLARAVAADKAGPLLDEVRAHGAGPIQQRIAEAGGWTVCRHDDAFPEGLCDAPDRPAALFGLGDRARLASLVRERTVTVVGARRATSYGREVAGSLARDLASAGFTVVSGMAWGIDGAAHRGALEGGTTVAVLGCGADVPYPRHHRGQHRRIRERGLVLSELPPGTTPWKWAFPARNRIMAGIAAMTVVVEAARHSGSLITAELAADLGRLVGAVPGPVGARMSAGTNQLLFDGAHVVREAQDVLDVLIGPGAPRIATTGPALEPELEKVLERVERGDTDPDSIAIALDRSAAEISVALVRLELLGYLEAGLSGTYSRTSLAAPDRVPPITPPT
ncbi:MAG: DNA-processing protein DprA [Actinomycetota bacterium]